MVLEHTTIQRGDNADFAQQQNDCARFVSPSRMLRRVRDFALRQRRSIMTAAAETTSRSIDSIVAVLDQFRQRATYGAVASVLKRGPRNLMQGRSRSQRDSWI